MKHRRWARLAIVLGLMWLAAGCGGLDKAGQSRADRDAGLPELRAVKLAAAAKLRVVATTAIVGDVVGNVGGEAIALTILMGPGQDPHSYQPTPQDVALVEKAHVVFVNGFHLEEGLEATIEAVADRGGPTVSVSAGITPRPGGDEHAGSQPAGDPHVWFDPAHVKTWARNIETTLSALDPANAAIYRANAAAYTRELDELDAAIRSQVAAIPPERRKLVTDHDVFGYFAERYDFTLVGAVIPAFSTTAEASAGELADLIGKIRAERAPAVFVGASVNPKAAAAVAAETGIPVIRLYTGELGAAGSGAETYLGMMRMNVEALAKALGR